MASARSQGRCAARNGTSSPAHSSQKPSAAWSPPSRATSSLDGIGLDPHENVQAILELAAPGADALADEDITSGRHKDAAGPALIGPRRRRVANVLASAGWLQDPLDQQFSSAKEGVVPCHVVGVHTNGACKVGVEAFSQPGLAPAATTVEGQDNRGRAGLDDAGQEVTDKRADWPHNLGRRLDLARPCL